MGSMGEVDRGGEGNPRVEKRIRKTGPGMSEEYREQERETMYKKTS